MISPTNDNRQPVLSPSENLRLQNVDALRGFALFGILAVNCWVFADPFYGSGTNNPAYASLPDQIVLFIKSFLFETKFYLLFSFLFGYSFTLQMTAAERAQASFLHRMLRRQCGLLMLGIVHGVCLFFGEILSLYATLGLILLACRGLEPLQAIKLATGLIILSGLVWILLGALALSAGELVSGDTSDAVSKLASFRGTATQTRQYHTALFPDTLLALVWLQGPSALAMFLSGFVSGRKRLFEHLPAYRKYASRILAITLPVGLAGALCYSLTMKLNAGSGYEVIAFGINQLSAPLLTASYLILMLLLFDTKAGQAIQNMLAPMGKLALTNYIMQSLILGLLFTGYGFGMIDAVPARLMPLIVIGIFSLQMLCSHWWLRKHRYGPCEWLLRACTNAAIP